MPVPLTEDDEGQPCEQHREGSGSGGSSRGCCGPGDSTNRREHTIGMILIPNSSKAQTPLHKLPGLKRPKAGAQRSQGVLP